MKNIGFIGLGTMGLPMAKNVIHGGFSLHAVPRKNTAPTDELQTLGATLWPDYASLAARCDVLISILPTDAEVRAVLLDAAVLEALPTGAVILEMTTGTAALMQELSAAYAPRGVHVFDCPVSGGPGGAKAGTLSLFCGGEAAVLERLRPLLDCMGKQIFHLGDAPGAGKVAKSINQLFVALNMLAIGEGLALARAQGVKLDTLFDAVKQSSGQSRIFDLKMPLLLEDRLSPAAFKLALMTKDLNIAVSGGEGLDLPFARAALALYQQGAEGDLRDLDFSAITRLQG